MLRQPPKSTLFPYTMLFRCHNDGILAQKSDKKLNNVVLATSFYGLFEHNYIVLVDENTILSMHAYRSEENTSELQSPDHLVCRLLIEKKKMKTQLNNDNRHF